MQTLAVRRLVADHRLRGADHPRVGRPADSLDDVLIHIPVWHFPLALLWSSITIAAPETAVAVAPCETGTVPVRTRAGPFCAGTAAVVHADIATFAARGSTYTGRIEGMGKGTPAANGEGQMSDHRNGRSA